MLRFVYFLSATLWYVFIKIFIGLFFLFVVLLVYALIRLLWYQRSYEQKPVMIDHLKEGDVIITGRNEKLYSWYIKISNILTHGVARNYWTHVALHIGEGKLVEAQPQGIRYYSVQEYLKDQSLVIVLRHKYLCEHAPVFNDISQFAIDTIDENYSFGFIGLLFYVLATFIPVSCNFIFNNSLIDRWCNLDNAYFCSELVADAYKQAGHPITPYDSWRVKPVNFLASPLFYEVSCAVTEPLQAHSNNKGGNHGTH